MLTCKDFELCTI